MIDRKTARQRMDALRDALREQKQKTDKPLLERLERCFVDGEGRYRCRSPACVRCRFINIRKQQRGTAELLGHFANEDLALVSVVLGATSNIGDVTTFIEKSRKDTKNRFAAARRKDERWRDTYLRAWHEVDAVGADHLPLLPPDRKKLLPAMAPIAFDAVTPVWVPTWHGVLFLNGLKVSEVAEVLQQQWSLDHQVDVRALDPKKTVAANLAKVTSYANKFHCSISLADMQTEQWPMHWQTQYFGWLHEGKRNAFEGLRMSINQADEPKTADKYNGRTYPPMPFTHSFSSVPMFYNTGLGPCRM